MRDVRSLESDDAGYRSPWSGRALHENQRVIIGVVELEAESEQATRRAALSRAVEIARQGREAAEAQGISAEEAGAAVDEAIAEARRRKHSKH